MIAWCNGKSVKVNFDVPNATPTTNTASAVPIVTGKVRPILPK